MVNALGVTYDRNWNVFIGFSNKGILNDLVSSISVGWWEEAKWYKVIYSGASIECKESVIDIKYLRKYP